MYESLLEHDYNKEIRLNCMKHTTICMLTSVLCTGIICIEWLIYYPKNEWLWWL